MNKLFISSKCSISPRRDLQIFLKFSMEAGKNITSETNLEADNTWKDLRHLLQYNVLAKKEVYSLAQVPNMYNCKDR